MHPSLASSRIYPGFCCTGTAQQVFEWGAKEECVEEKFFLNYFLFNLFLFLQKSGGSKAPPSAWSLLYESNRWIPGPLTRDDIQQDFLITLSHFCVEKGIIPPKKIAEKTLNQEYSESNLKRVPAILKCTLSQHFNPRWLLSLVCQTPI